MTDTSKNFFAKPGTSKDSGPPAPKQNPGQSKSVDPPEPNRKVATADSNAELPKESASGAPNVIQDIEMGLPGTGRGAGGAGDGNANSDMEIYSPERPLSIFGHKITTYKKVHRFMTFAIAPSWISIDRVSPAENQRWLTTSLASIPWELPILYLNPSEFRLIPKGSYVKEVRIKIVHRGNRIAFETGEVATRLATLNQVQNIVVGFGLNKTGWGVNTTYQGIESSNPMVPTAIGLPITGTYSANFYGVNNDDGDFTSYVPTHQVGIPFALPNYFTLANATQNTGGVPPITENLTFYDGKTTINHVVAEFNYKPKLSILKDPLKHIRSGLPMTPLTIPVNGCITSGHSTVVTSGSDPQSYSLTTVQNSPSNTNNQFNTLTGITDIIEKSQHLRQGPWGQYESAQIQPSLHVGIQAIPSLTATDLFGQISNWTDGQADWDVFCEMEVVEHEPTKLPHATIANVPAGKQIFRVSTGDTNDGRDSCTYAGLLPTQDIR